MHKNLYKILFLCANMLDNIRKDYHKILSISISKYQIGSKNSDV
jgi:hypothetical protein